MAPHQLSWCKQYSQVAVEDLCLKSHFQLRIFSKHVDKVPLKIAEIIKLTNV